jgi:D-alanyl-D-alanine carboxypeptidase
MIIPAIPRLDRRLQPWARPLSIGNAIRRVCRIAAIAAAVGGTITPAAAEALLLIEAESGRVLQAENATYPWYPASVTKLMTAYVTLKAVKEGRITLNSPFVVSAVALAQAPTKMGFRVGTVVTVDNALKMLMVKSANDMAVLLAEGVSGSVEAFADDMNAAARRLGMTQTSYVNPNGLPADGQITSARDLAILARAIYRELPEYDYFWHLPGIKFGRRVIRNYNKLIELYPGADGMKTGFICASGFNLVASATRGNRKLIAVVLGAPSASVRAYKAAKLLEQGFSDNRLSWLMPTLGTVDQLKPIDAAPPNLREQTCGAHRKRPAAEDEDIEVSGDGNGNSDGYSYSDSNGYSYSYSHCHCNSDANGHRHSRTYADAGGPGHQSFDSDACSDGGQRGHWRLHYYRKRAQACAPAGHWTFLSRFRHPGRQCVG